MSNFVTSFLYDLYLDLVTADSELVIVICLLALSIVVIDGARIYIRKQQRTFGITQKAKTISVDGGTTSESKNYISESLGLAGRPDAIILENGFLIPIERKPLSNKIRDRYIAQLLVYMRLIEEVEGIKPPYGYLILGDKCRRVKIDNTESRQRWLNDLITDMRKILDGGKAVPKPSPKKCANCNVNSRCEYASIR